jgi:hypothetical protein
MKRMSVWILPALLASVCTTTVVQAGQVSGGDRNTRLLAAAGSELSHAEKRSSAATVKVRSRSSGNNEMPTFLTSDLTPRFVAPRTAPPHVHGQEHNRWSSISE